MKEHGFEERNRNRLLPAMEAGMNALLLEHLPGAMKAGSVFRACSCLRVNKLPLGYQQPQPRVCLPVNKPHSKSTVIKRTSEFTSSLSSYHKSDKTLASSDLGSCPFWDLGQQRVLWYLFPLCLLGKGLHLYSVLIFLTMESFSGEQGQHDKNSKSRTFSHDTLWC